MLDLASKLGPVLQVGENLVWKQPAQPSGPPVGETPTPTPVPPSVDNISNDAERQGAYAVPSREGTRNDLNNNHNLASSEADDSSQTGADNLSQLPLQGFENLDRSQLRTPLGLPSSPAPLTRMATTTGLDPEILASPTVEETAPDALYAMPMKRSVTRGGLAPLTHGSSTRGGALPALSRAPLPPAHDPEDDDDNEYEEIEEQIETVKQRAM